MLDIKLKELKSLIKVCKVNGVSRVKLGDIEVELTGDAASSIKVGQKTALSTPQTNDAEEKTAVVQENLERIDEKLNQLHVEDPVEFERLLVQRELERDGDQTIN